VSESSAPPEPRRAPLWIGAATLLGAGFSFATVLLPARGLTFLWDDWIYLKQITGGPRPGCWLWSLNEHVMPLFLAAIDFEHALFGGNFTLYLVVDWLLHVANVFLLAKLLGARAGDERAGALGAAAFGVAVTYRQVLGWATGLCTLLSFLFTVVGFLALERARTKGKGFGLALAATALAPFAWGAGVALGPALALEEWALGERKTRRARVLLLGLAWAVPLAGYAALSSGAGGHLPRTLANVRNVAVFFLEAVGLGFVMQVPEIPVAPTPLAGVWFALGYASLIATAAYALPRVPRARLLLAHAYLALLLAPIALTRWFLVDGRWLPARSSPYQYFPAFAWATGVAIAAAAGIRRAPRTTLALGSILVGALAWGHARDAAADERSFSPSARREARSAECVAEIVSAARGARVPLYDFRLPVSLSIAETRASDVVRIVAPEVEARWTKERSPASVAPYEGLPVVREVLDAR
jgi:hypothetical protein